MMCKNEQALASSSSGPKNTTHAFTDRSSIPSRDDVSTASRPRQAPMLFVANTPLPPKNRDIAPAPNLPQPAALASSSSHKEGMSLSSPSQHIGGMSVPSPAQPNIKTSNFRPPNYSREWKAPSLHSIGTFPANTSISAQTLYESELLTPSSPSMAWSTTVSGPPSEASFEYKLRYVPFGGRFRGTAAQRALKARREQVAKEKRKAQDEGAVQWLINNINGNNEMDTVLAILGSFNRRWGREIWESLSAQGNPQPDVREAYWSSSIDVHTHTPSGLPHPPEGTAIHGLCKNMQYLFSTYHYEADFTNTEARRRRLHTCIQTTAALVCCTDFHLGWFGEIGEVLSEVGHNERIDNLSTLRLNPSFTLHWTCLSLVAIRQMLMVEGNRVRTLAEFAVSGIARFQLNYGAPDTAAFNGAQRIDGYLKTAWQHIEDLHRVFEPGDLNRTREEIREILRDRELPISELERIEIEADDMEAVDWRISLLQDAMYAATHELTRRLPGVSFIELKPSGPNPIGEAFGFPFFRGIPITPQFTFPGQQLRGLSALGRELRDIIEERKPWKYEETLENLASIDKIPIPLRRLNDITIRQLWRFQDLRDGDGLGFTIELFFHALRQLSSTPPMPELKRVLYIGTFKVITSGWENITDLSGTQRILLNLICDIIIKSRGVFSDFPYPDYIVGRLLELMGEMVDRHGNAHPQIHDAVNELWGVKPRNMDKVLRDQVLLVLGPFPLPTFV